MQGKRRRMIRPTETHSTVEQRGASSGNSAKYVFFQVRLFFRFYGILKFVGNVGKTASVNMVSLIELRY